MYEMYAKLRDAQKLNDLKVANATGIPPSTIYDWRQRSAENPQAKLSVDNLAKIAALFDVAIEYFLSEDPNETGKEGQA